MRCVVKEIEKIYIVLVGDYEKRHIDSVFTDKRKAETFVAIRGYGDIEEHTVFNEDIKLDDNDSVGYFYPSYLDESMPYMTNLAEYHFPALKSWGKHENELIYNGIWILEENYEQAKKMFFFNRLTDNMTKRSDNDNG